MLPKIILVSGVPLIPVSHRWHGEVPQRLRLPRPLPPVEHDPGEEQHEDEDHAAQEGHEPRLRDQVPHVAVVGVAENAKNWEKLASLQVA